MNKSVVFIIILLVIVLSIIVSQYFHKRHHEYKMADIEKAIRGAYPKGIGSISKEELVTAVKKYFHCSAKEAHYIIGVARRKKLVDIAAEYVTIMFWIKKKAFKYALAVRLGLDSYKKKYLFEAQRIVSDMLILKGLCVG